MKLNLTLLAAAAIFAAACAPKAGDTTKVVGKFGADAPAVVDISMGNILDTTVVVENGRFEVEIPKNLDWMEKFMSDYRAKIAEFGEDEEAAEEYLEGIIGKFDEYQKEAAKANPDNFVGLMALSQITDIDTEEMLALLNGLTDEMKATPQARQMLASFETLAKTGEGSKFVDFTVVQDPEHPETSTVKLSDYVGKGKYVLVDFWASWCGPCREEMPNLANIYKTYAGDNFDMLSIAVADRLEDTLEAAPALGIVWNQIVNAQRIPLELYGIDAIPHIILFGPDGTILKRNLRGEKIGEAVKEALGL